MRVAIVENAFATYHGNVGVALHEAGALVDLWRPYLDQRLPADPNSFDALVVFGGEQSAIADEEHPYLPRLAALMKATAAADKPVLGICLGAQLLARAFGATNQIGTAREFGWLNVELTPAGQTDAVFLDVDTHFPTFQWHSDTFTMPEGAVHLAKAPGSAHQCFRIGRAAYGVQFHFEASRAVVNDWTYNFASAIEKIEPGWVTAHPAQALKYGTLADKTGLRIARNWVALI